MPTKDNAFNLKDFPSHAEVDDELGDDPDLGSELDKDAAGADDDKDKKAPAKKAPAKKAPAKKAPAKKEEEEDLEEEEEDPEEEEEDPEEEEEDPEEEEEDPADKAPKKSESELKLEKKLARTARAREGLEAQVAELRQQLDQQNQQRSDASKAKFDKLMGELDTLYETVETARAEGKTVEAAKAQKRIDEIRDGMTRAQAASLATKEAMEQAEVRAYNTMVRELEALDERFDRDSDEYDRELVDDVGELVESYEAKGIPLTDALRKACKVLLREDVFAKGRSLKREDKPKVPPRKTDIEKNLKTAKKQPPEAPGVTKEKAPADIDMSTISEKDFAALPESTLRRLLGNDG